MPSRTKVKLVQHAPLFVLIYLALASCSPKVEPPAGLASTPGTQLISAPTLPLGDRFEVEAWVDKPVPDRNERVTVSGSLIKNGVYLGGMMMQATWPDEAQERGVPNCYVLVIYQRGVCTIEARNFPSGVFVPITVTFEYKGVKYRGETGFTPQ